MKPLTIVVIGGNAAGAAAAAKAKRVNPDAKVILIEKSAYISVGVCEFPYVLSREIKAPSSLLFFSAESFESEKKVKVLINSNVSSIDIRNRLIYYTGLQPGITESIEYDKLILATGAKQRVIPGLSEMDLNVLYLKNYSDLLKTMQYLDGNEVKDASVIGSGFLGLEIADALVRRGIEVYLFENKSRPLPSADPEFSEIIRNILKKKGVNFIPNSGELNFISDNGRVKSVKAAGQLFSCDAVFPTIGFLPVNNLAIHVNLKLGEQGEIKVDSFLRTSEPNIFAAGDVAGFREFISGKPTMFFNAKVAHNTGHIAGTNAAGGRQQFNGALQITSLRIFDNYFASVGLTEKNAREHNFVTKSSFEMLPNLVHVMPGSILTAGKLVVNKTNGQILGASFLGGSEVSGLVDLISLFIRNRLTYHQFNEVDFNYTPTLSPFLNILMKLSTKLK